MAPLDFIPIAERTGFVVPLGTWILREACLQLAEWHRSLPLRSDLWVSVNISSAQWSDPTLVDQIEQALRDSDLEPQHLVLELTEGIAIANPTAVTTLLMQLRAMGVRISVDDFGTGYSSLAYLRQFPIDTLKLDRSFVRGMVTNKDTAEIIAGVMNLSKQLGLSVVAEGIEHEDQRAHLRALNCHAGQGNLFATPLDVESATEVLKTGLAPRLERQPEAKTRPNRETNVRQLIRSWTSSCDRSGPVVCGGRPRTAGAGGTDGGRQQRPIGVQRSGDARSGSEAAIDRDDTRGVASTDRYEGPNQGTTTAASMSPVRRQAHPAYGSGTFATSASILAAAADSFFLRDQRVRPRRCW